MVQVKHNPVSVVLLVEVFGTRKWYLTCQAMACLSAVLACTTDDEVADKASEMVENLNTRPDNGYGDDITYETLAAFQTWVGSKLMEEAVSNRKWGEALANRSRE